jgi:putative transposase
MQLATQQKWAAFIEQQQESNLTIAQFCKQLSVSPSTFYQRKRELNLLPNTSSSFIKATVTQQLEIETTRAPILLNLGKVNLSLPPQTSADYIVSIINGISS